MLFWMNLPESYKRSEFVKNGINVDFVQDNHSKSVKNVLRELDEPIMENMPIQISTDIDIKEKHGKKIDDFFSNFTDIHFTNGIGLHNK